MPVPSLISSGKVAWAVYWEFYFSPLQEEYLKDNTDNGQRTQRVQTPAQEALTFVELEMLQITFLINQQHKGITIEQYVLQYLLPSSAKVCI